MGKAVAALAMCGLLLTATAGSCQSPPPSDVEVEDCDLEDWKNREDDCGFTDRHKKPATKPQPAKPPPGNPQPVKPPAVKNTKR